eukprot:TRINITY_DN2198_c0_g2_i1.p1 TRINITY_DN2198_c0_g2~~TRINITY_DN2198_c0_g2_i1.p1  ORF type:complete len:724 (+),score=212.39 TRINITY_DN2198_c0_g2_i1:174-2174(+)
MSGSKKFCPQQSEHHGFRQVDGPWVLYWDESNAGWWFAEQDNYNVTALFFAPGDMMMVPVSGWQWRGMLGLLYYDVPIDMTWKREDPPPEPEVLDLKPEEAEEDGLLERVKEQASRSLATVRAAVMEKLPIMQAAAQDCMAGCYAYVTHPDNGKFVAQLCAPEVSETASAGLPAAPPAVEPSHARPGDFRTISPAAFESVYKKFPRPVTLEARELPHAEASAKSFPKGSQLSEEVDEPRSESAAAVQSAADIRSHQEELRSLQAESAEKLQNLEAALGAAHAERTALQQQAAKKEQDCQQLRQHVEHLQRETEYNASFHDELRSSLAAKDAQIKELEEYNVSYHDEMQSLLASKDFKIKQIEEGNAALHHELQTSLTAKEAKIAELEELASQASRGLQADAALEAAKADVAEAREIADAQTRRCEALEVALEAARAQAPVASTEERQLRQLRDEYEVRIQELEKALEDKGAQQQQEIEASIKEHYERRIHELDVEFQASLQALQLRETELAAAKSELLAKQENLNTDQASLEDRIAELEGERVYLVEDNTKLLEDLGNLQDSVSQHMQAKAEAEAAWAEERSSLEAELAKLREALERKEAAEKVRGVKAAGSASKAGSVASSPRLPGPPPTSTQALPSRQGATRLPGHLVSKRVSPVQSLIPPPRH